MTIKTASRGILVAACLAALQPAGELLARDGEVRTYVWDLSAYIAPCAQPCYLDALLVGPLGGTVVDARLKADFQPIDRYDPAAIFFDLFGPIVQPDGSIGGRWHVTGADLGWSGRGLLAASVRTDLLDGPIAVIDGLPLTLWLLHVGNIANPYNGRLTRLRYELDMIDLVADETCTGDLDGDGVITERDLAILHDSLGVCPPGGCPADLNGDGVVDALDVQILVFIRGGVCPVVPGGAGSS